MTDAATTASPEHDRGFRPSHRPGSFLDRRDLRPTAEDAIRAAASPMALLAWQAENGLTVASVSRYLLNLLGPVTE